MAWDQLIPGMIGLMLFGVPTGFFLWLCYLGAVSQSWPTISGKVTTSYVKSLYVKVLPRSGAIAKIRYTYEVHGKSYTNDVVCFGDFLNASQSDARKKVQRYGLGSCVTVHYHPKRPQLATLEPRTSGFLALWIAIGLGAIGSITCGLITGS